MASDRKVKEDTKSGELSVATAIRLGQYSPYTDFIENVIWSYKSAVPRILAIDESLINQYPSEGDYQTHPSRFLHLAPIVFLPETLRETLRQSVLSDHSNIHGNQFMCILLTTTRQTLLTSSPDNIEFRLLSVATIIASASVAVEQNQALINRYIVHRCLRQFLTK